MNAPFLSLGIAFDALGVRREDRIRWIELWGCTTEALAALNAVIAAVPEGTRIEGITATDLDPDFIMKLNPQKPTPKPPIIALDSREFHAHLDRLPQPRRERARRAWSRFCDRLPSHCNN